VTLTTERANPLRGWNPDWGGCSTAWRPVAAADTIAEVFGLCQAASSRGARGRSRGERLPQKHMSHRVAEVGHRRVGPDRIGHGPARRACMERFLRTSRCRFNACLRVRDSGRECGRSREHGLSLFRVETGNCRHEQLRSQPETGTTAQARRRELGNALTASLPAISAAASSRRVFPTPAGPSMNGSPPVPRPLARRSPR
jgi:hypothetical protein